MKSILFFGLVLCCGLFSCQQFVELDISTDPQMGITCFLSPDDSLATVSIYATQRVGQPIPSDPNEQVVADAKVRIRKLATDDSLILAFDPTSLTYLAPVFADFFEAGATYLLEVSHPDFPDAIGSCRLPEAPQGLVVELDSVGEGFLKDYFVQLSWTAPPEDSTYFRVIGRVGGPRRVSDPYPIRWEGDLPDMDYLLLPIAQEGQLQSPLGNLQALDREISGRVAGPLPGDSLTIDLLQVSKSYYHFQSDLRNARGSDPTVSEPYLIYSNLEGAIGVFAMYQRVRQQIRIR
ncbi:MAG: DUF4249 family protein [Bacteroidota bacterium]